MNISKAAVTRLAKAHSHSAAILKSFSILLEAQLSLVADLPPPPLPELDSTAFSLGKPWMQAADIPFADGFAPAAYKKLLSAASRAFPERKEAFAALRKVCSRHSERVVELTRLHLGGHSKKISAWAARYEADPDAVLLLASQLAQTAARAVAAAVPSLPAWNKSCCPICGSAPHAFFLKDKEGKRYLQCGLCGHDWRFSRTTCPACGQDRPEQLSITFIEGCPEQRADACFKCKSYLLGLDTRALIQELPLPLYLAAMAPLDLLMQEEGFAPMSIG